MTDQNWKDESYDNYNFVVKPGTPDRDDGSANSLSKIISQQAKAWRACTFDRYGTDGALTEKHYEMMDDDIRDMEEELANRDFNEAFDQLSDDEALYTARSWLINLTANNNEIARKMGFDDEQIDNSVLRSPHSTRRARKKRKPSGRNKRTASIKHPQTC